MDKHKDIPMSLEKIENLVEKLSCDLILADPDEPESLSSLLPILKQAHDKYRKLSLNDGAKEILRARKIIDLVLKNNTKDVNKEMGNLNDIVSGLSSSIIDLKAADQVQDSEDLNFKDSIPVDTNLNDIYDD